MIRISTMMRTTVAPPTSAKASLNVLSLSTNVATSPATPAVSCVPFNWDLSSVRIVRTASSSAGSSGVVASNPTLMSCIDLSGATNCGPVTKPWVRGIALAFKAFARSPTFDTSLSLSGAPSVRLTTIVAVAVACCGNAFWDSWIACTASYLLGRKSLWSAEVMSLSEGENPMIAAATSTQPPITHHALRTTKLPSRPNIGSP
jgi:hypothetical protein